jgi:hypothetical protein
MRRSRSLLGDNLPLHYRGRRFSRCDGACADDAPLHRRHSKVALNFRRLNLLRIHANGGSADGTRVHERVMRNRGHRLDVVLVHVGDFINRHVIVYVRNIHDVHRRIRDIHLLHVALARAVGRNVNFARTKREPRDASPSTTE